MKKILLYAAVFAATLLGACTRVDPGHVGVKVNRYGSDAGVEAKALGVGTYQTMFGVDVYEYPIYTNNYVWQNTLQRNEDGTTTGRNEELTFQDRNGLVVSADVNVAYRVNPARAPRLFQDYRADMDGIVAGPLRNRVRSAIVTAASTMTVEEIYGPKKAVLIAAALKSVRGYFEPRGLHVDQLDWAGPIRIPENILERINARAQNEQAAIAAQANVATEEAKARSRVAAARGVADAKLVEAEAEAKSIKIKADAVAANPKIVDYTYAIRWNGQTPSTVFCSSATPCSGVGR